LKQKVRVTDVVDFDPAQMKGYPVANREDGEGVEILGFLGVGLDNEDSHQRLTRSDSFLLIGGSAETHERMQDTAIRFGEALQKRGKTLQETSRDEALDLLRESLEG
jgi:hypothetical protein